MFSHKIIVFYLIGPDVSGVLNYVEQFILFSSAPEGHYMFDLRLWFYETGSLNIQLRHKCMKNMPLAQNIVPTIPVSLNSTFVTTAYLFLQTSLYPYSTQTVFPTNLYLLVYDTFTDQGVFYKGFFLYLGLWFIWRFFNLLTFFCFELSLVKQTPKFRLNYHINEQIYFLISMTSYNLHYLYQLCCWNCSWHKEINAPFSIIYEYEKNLIK